MLPTPSILSTVTPRKRSQEPRMKLTNGINAVKDSPPDTPRIIQAPLATWLPAVGSKMNKKTKRTERIQRMPPAHHRSP